MLFAFADRLNINEQSRKKHKKNVIIVNIYIRTKKQDNIMIINNQKKIDFFKRYFAKKNLICVDTEFERKKTYFSKLSIITISDGKKFFIFDIFENPKQIS